MSWVGGKNECMRRKAGEMEDDGLPQGEVFMARWKNGLIIIRREKKTGTITRGNVTFMMPEKVFKQQGITEKIIQMSHFVFLEIYKQDIGEPDVLKQKVCDTDEKTNKQNKNNKTKNNMGYRIYSSQWIWLCFYDIIYH